MDDGPPLRVKPETRAATFEGHGAMRLAFDALYQKLDALGLGEGRVRPSDYWRVRGHMTFVQHLGQTYSPPLVFAFDFAATSDKKDSNVAVFCAPVQLESGTVYFYGAFFGTIELLGTGKVLGTFTRSTYMGEIVVQQGDDPAAALAAHGEKVETSLKTRGFRVL